MKLELEMSDLVYDDRNSEMKVEDSYMGIKYYKTNADFCYDLEYTVSYIKKIEALVRKDPRYTSYKAYLLECGFNKCAILGNIDNDKAELEMHHGPIFTLFDISFIVLNKRRNKGEKISTFRIAKEVLDIHYKNMVQIVMLSKSVHEQDHENTGFISMRHCCAGNIFDFLEEYGDGLEAEHRIKTLDYLRASTKYDSDFGDVFKLENYVTDWK